MSDSVVKKKKYIYFEVEYCELGTWIWHVCLKSGNDHLTTFKNCIITAKKPHWNMFSKKKRCNAVHIRSAMPYFTVCLAASLTIPQVTFSKFTVVWFVSKLIFAH